jgi:hypothetical protein
MAKVMGSIAVLGLLGRIAEERRKKGGKGRAVGGFDKGSRWSTGIESITIIELERMEAANREMLLSFWKLHILHHAGAGPVRGPWVLTELRRHGYEISPGTLYPFTLRNCA